MLPWKKRDADNKLGQQDESASLGSRLCYYQYSAADGHEQEIFSCGIRKLFAIDDYAQSLKSILVKLDEDSAIKLREAFEHCRDHGEAFNLILHVKNSGNWLASEGWQEQYNGTKKVLVLFHDVSRLQEQIAQQQQEIESMRKEGELFRSLLNVLPFPVWRRNDFLQVTYCNKAYAELLEISNVTATKPELLELDKQSLAFARQVKTQGVPQIDRRHVVLKGARRFLHIIEVPLSEGMIGGAFDLTELDDTREQLSRHVAAHSELLESSASAMAVFGADTKLKFYNNAYISLWKLDETFLSAQPTYGEVLEKLREKRRLPEQANFPVFKQKHIKLFTDLIEPQEEFFYLPDGATLRVIVIPHALGGLLFVYEDMTDRLHLERSYNTLIAVQRATLDNLHEGVAVFGEDGKIKLSNPTYAKLWGLDTELISQDRHLTEILEVTKNLYEGRNWEEFRNQLLSGIHSRVVHSQRLERSDGSVVDWSSVPLPDGATLMTYLDVTDSTLVERSLREKNDALQEADRMKSEFLANVSYELRSPLTSIIGFSEVLKQHYFGELNEKQREYMDGIYQSSQHLMHLINDIIDIACIEAGYMTLDVTKFEIHGMLTAVLSLARAFAKENGITLHFNCEETIGSMQGDETRLRQAVFNLLSNAIKFNRPQQPKEGQVTVGARIGDNDTVVIWVEDNGIGIPPEEQETIFERFYKGRAAVRASGTGLGLSMVKSFVEIHGGKISLISTPEQGTTITCILPRHHLEIGTMAIPAPVQTRERRKVPRN